MLELPPPLAGEGWGGGYEGTALSSASIPTFPRKRGKEQKKPRRRVEFDVSAYY
jgi:hypothetical protein